MDQQAQPHVALPDVPAVGDVIAEKYRVEGILGVGGMGVVLVARHLQLGQTVAIKVLSAGEDRQQDAIDRFLREGRAAAALTSDHVVRIYDVGQLPTGVPYMVMERLRGRDLSSLLIEFGPLCIADAVEYIAQATVAIVETHDVGIIHRDLKPSNLFLTRRSDDSPCIKVLDFGISKHLTDGDPQTLRAALTSTRQVMGSPAYMSPEQVRDAKTVDYRTDIWALGATLYELLTHHPAFEAETLPAICAAIAADPLVPVRTRRPDVPDAIESIVQRCLEKVPSNRFSSARQLLIALRSWQGKPAEQTISSRSDPPDCAANAAFDAAMWRDRRRSVDSASCSGRRSLPDTHAEEVRGTLLSGKGPTMLRVLSNGESGHDTPVLNAHVANDSHHRTTEAPVLAAAHAVVGTSLAHEFPAQGSVEGAAIDLTPSRISDAGHSPDAIARRRNDPSKPSRRGILILAAGLLLCFATMTWFVFHREAAPSSGAEQRATRASSESLERFMLRIESNPTAATVIEAGKPLGVTPLSIEIDRTVVRRSARQFVIRKAGFVDVSIRQEDSPTDVRQNVSLASFPVASEASPPTQMTHSRKKVSVRPAPAPASHTKSLTPSATAPQIRTTR